MTNKKRIILALDDKYIKLLDSLCVAFCTKQYSKVIKQLLDLFNVFKNVDSI